MPPQRVFSLEEEEEHFWTFVNKETESGCWLWTGNVNAVNRYGYYNARFTGITSAHRYSKMLEVGALKDQECVLHRCENKHCVNPKHLYVGSHAENSSDLAHKNARFYEGEIWLMRKLKMLTYLSYAQIGRMFKCSRQCVFKQVMYKTMCKEGYYL